jgi:signal transduction histidine kinase
VTEVPIVTGANDPTFELLLARGLLSVARARRDQSIVRVRGGAEADLPIGAQLCGDAVPALCGLEDEVVALKGQPQERLVVANITMIGREGVTERFDYVAFFDADADQFVLSIMSCVANDQAGIEQEQNLRARAQLERQVAAQAAAIASANEAIKRTNADLINFTRIISHDLKAPMRAIRYSADDIEAALVETDDATQLDALAELRTHSNRMAKMVTDLLAYSRLEDKAHAIAVVDTHDMVESVVTSLARPEALKINIVGVWPKISTIGALLDVVVRNLLDNAVKHHDRDHGEIHISAAATDEWLVISVADDGPGIPEKYQQAVLRPFIKVNRNQTGGSGMGLSMVHKVVADIGGRLEVGNRPNGERGTIVTVSWPLTNKAI